MTPPPMQTFSEMDLGYKGQIEEKDARIADLEGAYKRMLGERDDALERVGREASAFSQSVRAAEEKHASTIDDMNVKYVTDLKAAEERLRSAVADRDAQVSRQQLVKQTHHSDHPSIHPSFLPFIHSFPACIRPPTRMRIVLCLQSAGKLTGATSLCVRRWRRCRSGSRL